MKMKVTQREERKSFLPIGCSASFLSRVFSGVRDVTHRWSEYVSENMDV